jgi:coproporphyrinogen III oxidase
MIPSANEIQEWFRSLQEAICMELEQADGMGRFVTDEWIRPGGGGGLTRVMVTGSVIEKGGVNFSAVHGKAPEPVLRSLGIAEGSAMEFLATGVSIVIHPVSPRVPIIHMNVRYFELSNGRWWFGGGIDLTPHYVVKEDAHFFHRQLKRVCDNHHTKYYSRFNRWADDYFFLKHRNETRGIGGIFFDYLDEREGIPKCDLFSFVQDVGRTFAPTYVALMNKNRNLPYGEKEKQWQYLRRGRYVEFNLVWDRGTKFGLETDGRTESILMSLPPQAQWEYNHHPAEGSEEALTLSFLKKGVNWVEA